MTDHQYTVEYFVKKLTPRVEAAVGVYEQLADDMAEAWKQLKHADFEELCARLRIEYETGFRLAKIAVCPRIKNHAPRLRGLGWGTQYAVTTLTDAEFNQFAADNLKPEDSSVISRQLVKSYHHPKPRRKAASKQPTEAEGAPLKAALGEHGGQSAEEPMGWGESAPLSDVILTVRCSRSLSSSVIRKVQQFITSIQGDDLTVYMRDDLKTALATLHVNPSEGPQPEQMTH